MKGDIAATMMGKGGAGAGGGGKAQVGAVLAGLLGWPHALATTDQVICYPRGSLHLHGWSCRTGTGRAWSAGLLYCFCLAWVHNSAAAPCRHSLYWSRHGSRPTSLCTELKGNVEEDTLPTPPFILQGKGQFSKDELKQLFTLRSDTACDTYDILQVECPAYSLWSSTRRSAQEFTLLLGPARTDYVE